jgi:CRISPR-associated protein Cas1
MSVLYLNEPRATLRRDAACLIVTRDSSTEGGPRREVLLRLPPHQLELVALVGDAHVTADATHFCLDHGIGLAWFTAGGRFRGRLVPVQPRAADLRLRQYAAWQNPVGRLARAVGVVAAKLCNAARLLADHQSNYPDPALAVAGATLLDLARRAPAAGNPAALLGLEGTGARTYFTALGRAFRGVIPFAGRAHRPAPDPANALLSLG